ncbi:MAG: hypothetical protein ACLTTU_05120 [Bilophila wadsworthia]
MSFLRVRRGFARIRLSENLIHCGNALRLALMKRTYETFGPERHTPEIRPNEILGWLCMKCPRPAPAERCGLWPP